MEDTVAGEEEEAFASDSSSMQMRLLYLAKLRTFSMLLAMLAKSNLAEGECRVEGEGGEASQEGREEGNIF